MFVRFTQTAEIFGSVSTPLGTLKVQGKGFPYSTPSVGPGADPGVQAVSL